MFYDVDEIYHYGIKRKSGRYPYGSGDKWGKKKNDPGKDQRAKVKKLKEEKKQAKIDESRRRKDEELKQIAQRMQSIADIKKFSPEKVNKVKNFFGRLDNVANYIGTATKLYTNVMKAVNAVSGDSSSDNEKKKKKKKK